MKNIKTLALVAIIALTFGTIVFAADTKAPEMSAAKAKLVDINTATEDQLKALPGVGAENARNIIASRPYHQTGELNTKKIIPADVYGKINKLIKALC